jgi:hypothetical protein
MSSSSLEQSADQGVGFVMKLFEPSKHIKGMLVETTQEGHTIGISYAVNKREPSLMINLLIDGVSADDSLYLLIEPSFKEKLFASFVTISKPGQVSADSLAEKFGLYIYNMVNKAMATDSAFPDSVDEKDYTAFLESKELQVIWASAQERPKA